MNDFTVFFDDLRLNEAQNIFAFIKRTKQIASSWKRKSSTKHTAKMLLCDVLRKKRR